MPLLASPVKTSLLPALLRLVPGPVSASIASNTHCSSSMPRAPSTFLTHGGGPMPLLGQDPNLAEFLAQWPRSLGEGIPAALVIISAHWEEREVSVTSGESPPLIYDYGGFPPESYKYKYDAPGHPALAERIGALVSEAGLGKARMRPDRGWDHGVFVATYLRTTLVCNSLSVCVCLCVSVSLSYTLLLYEQVPMMLAFPAATVPIVVVSLISGNDPTTHWQLGRALRPLRDEGIAIVGSGSSCALPSHPETSSVEIRCWAREFLLV